MSRPEVLPARSASFRREEDGTVTVLLTDGGHSVAARIGRGQMAKVVAEVLDAYVIPQDQLPEVVEDEFGWLVTRHGEPVERTWAHPGELRRQVLSQMSALAWLEKHAEAA